MGVEILPAELPKDASLMFSEKMAEYLPKLLRYFKNEAAKEEELPLEI